LFIGDEGLQDSWAHVCTPLKNSTRGCLRRLQPAFSASVPVSTILAASVSSVILQAGFLNFRWFWGLFDTVSLRRVLSLSARLLQSLLTCSVTRQHLGTLLLRNEDAGYASYGLVRFLATEKPGKA
ncbi:hypothetical protein NDU88_006346, partial [Pleurodeles waltl]